MFKQRSIWDYKCPYCGGKLRYDSSSLKLLCYNCNAKFDEDKLNARLDAEEKEKQQQEKDVWNKSFSASDWGDEKESLKAYTCPSCGAELICDKSTAVTACPYCDNYAIIESQFPEGKRPEYVLPFKLSREDAVAALKKHYDKRPLLPKGFVDNNHIEEIKAVYVPYWMFESKAQAHQFYRTIKRSQRKKLFRTKTKTEYYHIYRTGSMEFDRVFVDASSKMPDDYMYSIGPFDFAEMKPFSTAYLPGFLAERYDVSSIAVTEKLDKLYKDAIREAVKKTVRGYDEVNLEEELVTLADADIHYVLLPAWLLSTNWEGKNYLFAMNGQSGKMVGELPVCRKRRNIMFAAIAGPLMAIGTALSFLLR